MGSLGAISRILALASSLTSSPDTETGTIIPGMGRSGYFRTICRPAWNITSAPPEKPSQTMASGLKRSSIFRCTLIVNSVSSIRSWSGNSGYRGIHSSAPVREM